MACSSLANVRCLDDRGEALSIWDVRSSSRRGDVAGAGGRHRRIHDEAAPERIDQRCHERRSQTNGKVDIACGARLAVRAAGDAAADRVVDAGFLEGARDPHRDRCRVFDQCHATSGGRGPSTRSTVALPYSLTATRA